MVSKMCSHRKTGSVKNVFANGFKPFSSLSLFFNKLVFG